MVLYCGVETPRGEAEEEEERRERGLSRELKRVKSQSWRGSGVDFSMGSDWTGNYATYDLLVSRGECN